MAGVSSLSGASTMMLALDMLIFHHLITNLTNVANDTDIRAICPFG